MDMFFQINYVTMIAFQSFLKYFLNLSCAMWNSIKISARFCNGVKQQSVSHVSDHEDPHYNDPGCLKRMYAFIPFPLYKRHCSECFVC